VNIMSGNPNGLERRRVSEALWTADEVAAFIKCSVSYVYKAAERGEIPGVRVGRMLRFKPDTVRTLVLGGEEGGFQSGRPAMSR
jgi:excisionase family DNA binding protein